MIRLTSSMIIAGVLAMAGMVALSLYIATRPTTLRIAVGPANSEDARLVHTLSQQLARERAGVRLRTVVKENPAESAALLDSGQADLAVVRGDLGLPRSGQVVAILRKNVAVLMVPGSIKTGDKPPDIKSKTAKPKPSKMAAAKSKGASKSTGKSAVEKEATATLGNEDEAVAANKTSSKVDGLIGKRVGVIGRESFNVRLLGTVLSHYEIAAGAVQVVQVDPAAVSSAVREGKVDALLATGPLGSPILAEAVAAAALGRETPTFIEIGEAEAIAQRSPVYESAEIVPGAFGGSPPKPPEKIQTIGFSHYFVARRTLDDATVAEFTRLLFGARQQLAAESPAFSKIHAPDTDKDAAVAVHPGAAAYIDGDQKTFFDRYGDLMYWGIMLLSFMGSGVAGVASYLNSGERSRSRQSIERLMDLVQAARQATQPEQLDGLQAEADDILNAAIRRAEGDQLDMSDFAAFSLALNQVRLAIGDRRAVLLNQVREKKLTRAKTIAPA